MKRILLDPSNFWKNGLFVSVSLGIHIDTDIQNLLDVFAPVTMGSQLLLYGLSEWHQREVYLFPFVFYDRAYRRV